MTIRELADELALSSQIVEKHLWYMTVDGLLEMCFRVKKKK